MPRVVMNFDARVSDGLPISYRLVDQRPSGDSHNAACVIERYVGVDAMGVQQWAYVDVLPLKTLDPEPRRALVALFDTLADMMVQPIGTVTITGTNVTSVTNVMPYGFSGFKGVDRSEREVG